MIADAFRTFRYALAVRLREYCERKLNRGKIMPEFERILKPSPGRATVMPSMSPHWKTAPSTDPGDRAAQFVECDRCGYRSEDTSMRDRKCQRLKDPTSLQLGCEWRRCDGTLKGKRTEGW